MCYVFLVVNPFRGTGEVVSDLLPPVTSQMSAASENNLESTILEFEGYEGRLISEEI